MGNRVLQGRGARQARTTIADIAREAGVSRAAFYIYYASKSDVFKAVALRVRDAFLTAQGIARPAAPAHVIAEATYGIFTQFAHHTAANPSGYDETVNHLTAMYLRFLGMPEGN